MSDKKTYKASEPASAPKKRRKKKKDPKKTLAICLAAICIVGVAIFAMDKAISGMYNQGGNIPDELRTDGTIDKDVVNILVSLWLLA